MSTEIRGGVFVVRYDSPEALSPERQAELAATLRAVATRGFSAANILRDTAVAVKPFADERTALEWVTAEVTRARGA